MTRRNRAPLVYGSVVCAGMALLLSSSALAETATGTLDVSAQVVAACEVTNIIHLEFGVYDPTDEDQTPGTAQFSISCTTHANVDVSLSGGAAEEGGQRHMSNGSGNVLRYDLYQDEATTIDFIVDQATQITVPPGAPTAVPVYGVIPAEQSVLAGFYNDPVQINLSF